MTAVAERTELEFPLVRAHKEKDRTPYVVHLGERHLRVLQALARHRKEGLSDAELTFKIELHMAAARRCELRDIGAVRRAGRHRRSWRWKLTDRGLALLSELHRHIESKGASE